jgi:flagellin
LADPRTNPSDAARIQASPGVTTSVRADEMKARNASHELSIVQTAEAHLNEVANILIRVRQLAAKSASAGVGPHERASIQRENAQLQAELQRLAANGALTDSLLFGAAIKKLPQISVDFGVDAATSLAGLQAIDNAIQVTDDFRAVFNMTVNRPDNATHSTLQSIQPEHDESRLLRDTNHAEEASNRSRMQIMIHAGVSVLAQANQTPQVALKLLQ